jgi:hypothetical protein
VPKIHQRKSPTGGPTGNELSLWDLADPGAAVRAAVALYGSGAATAAAHCALTAHFDGRTRDYRFWCTVFHELGCGSAKPN